MNLVSRRDSIYFPREGSPDLRHVLTEAAHAASRPKNTWPLNSVVRGTSRRQQAAIAVGHSILIIVWHLLDHSDPTMTSAPTTSTHAQNQPSHVT